jgi:hypothetical protein
MGPRPVYAGVDRAAGGTAAPFSTSCFGFNAALAGQPEKLARIMSMVEIIANDSPTYLSARFGVEGIQWKWEWADGRRYPVRLPGSGSLSSAGRYWILPWSSNDATYLLSPGVLDSIDKLFGSPGTMYGSGALAGSLRPFAIPYATASQRALEGSIRMRFMEEVLIPILYDSVDFEVFDRFAAWYRDNGGDELERIVNGWAARTP